MYPLNIDERGSFQELAHLGDVEFGQLSILQINPQCKRGGHYHTHKKEWFCCIHGECDMVVQGALDDSFQQISLSDSKKEFVSVGVYKVHTVVNTSLSEVCKVLIIASEEYDPNDPDTIKFE